MTMENFSNDKRKYGHVTDMFGLNRTNDEMQIGVTRLNWLVQRDNAFSTYKCCHVAGCLALAAPNILSTW